MLLVHSQGTEVSQIQQLLLNDYNKIVDNNNYLEPVHIILYLVHVLPSDPVMTAQGHQVRAWIWQLVVMVEQSAHLALQIGS
jgi:hypothetical protein